MNEHFFFFRFRFGSGELIDVWMYIFFFRVCLSLLHSFPYPVHRHIAHSYIASEILTFRMITLSFCQLLILFLFLLFDSLSLWINLVRTSFVRLGMKWNLCTGYVWCYVGIYNSTVSSAHMLCKQWHNVV